ALRYETTQSHASCTNNTATRRWSLSKPGLRGLFAQSGERVDRRHDVVGAGQRRGIARDRVANAVFGARHSLEHALQARLLAAEAHEDRAVVDDVAVSDV